MPAILRNNANGGTNGASVSYTASGGADSGEDWDFIYMGTNGSITYADKPARGNLSYKCSVGATVADVKMEWQRFQPSDTVYVRFYVFLPSLPSGSFRFFEFSDGTQLAFSFGCLTDGKIRIRDSAAAAMATSTTSLPTGRWVRLEAKVNAHGSTGGAVVKIFTEADSPYPAEVLTSTNTFNTAPNGTGIKIARFGIIGSAGANFTYYLDDIELNNTGYTGPADPSVTMQKYICNNADMGTNGVAVTAENSGDSNNRFFQDFSQPGQIVYSSTQYMHAPLSYRFNSVSGSENSMTWRGFHTNAAALRIYGYFTALPSETTVFAQLVSYGGGFLQQAWLVLMPNGKIGVIDGSSSLIWTSPSSINLNTWYRYEISAELGETATTGHIEAAYYMPNSWDAEASFSTNTANLGLNPIHGARFGKLNATTYDAPFYLDSISVRQDSSALLGLYTGSPGLHNPNPSGMVPHLGWGREV